MSNKQKNEQLIPMIIQDANGGGVLSLFYANSESLEKMKQTGFVWRYSRSQNKVIQKGASSGNIQKVISVSEDCDSDALLIKVLSYGPACHKNTVSCFNEFGITDLLRTIKDRKTNPKDDSYVSKLFSDEVSVKAKIIEESNELVDTKSKSEIVWEAADLLFFMLVYLEKNDVELYEVIEELKGRSVIKSSK